MSRQVREDGQGFLGSGYTDAAKREKVAGTPREKCVGELSFITKSSLFVYKEFPKGLLLKSQSMERSLKEKREMSHFNASQ